MVCASFNCMGVYVTPSIRSTALDGSRLDQRPIPIARTKNANYLSATQAPTEIVPSSMLDINVNAQIKRVQVVRISGRQIKR